MKTEATLSEETAMSAMDTEATANDSSGRQNQQHGRFPLYLRVLTGVVLGAVFGLLFGLEPIVFRLGNEDLGELGMLVIRLLKALAVPLVLFAILDALLRTRIGSRQIGRLILICLVNVTVAILIGLTLMNALRPGDRWRNRFPALTDEVQMGNPALTREKAILQQAAKASLSPLKNISGYVPKSLLDPFVENNIITVVLAGVLAGAALRRVKERQLADRIRTFETIEQSVEVIYQTLVQMLSWVVQAIPFAVLGVVAEAVGRSGLAVFQSLWVFVAVILAGMALHALVYYPLMAWWRGGITPRTFFGHGADAILTGLSTNSSLATVPVTLRCLTEKMGVSQQSARLSACVGTNLNNDGITLYEAMAALFLAQACGLELTSSQQFVVVLASLMAGIGVAGVPEAGLIVLPLVLSAAGLPEAVIAVAIPLILAVDWLVARVRSAVNVMSDMLVAILLDQSATREGRLHQD